MVERLKKALHELWAPSRYTIPVNQGQLTQARLTDKAFTLQDAPSVKSPPAAAVGGTSRPRIVSPGVLEDLAAAATVDAPALDHDDVLPVSGRARTSQASKRAAAATGDDDERVVEEPRDDGHAGTRVRGAGSGTGIRREGGAEASEEGNDGVDGPDVVPALKGSPDQARREESSVISGDALPLPTADGRRQEQTPKRSSTPKRRAVESCEVSKPATGVVSQGAATGDGRRREARAGEDSSSGHGEVESEAERSSRKKNRRDGATKSGGSSRTEAVTSDGGNGATTSPAGGVSAAVGTPTAAPPGGALAFDMQSILGGCRKASRLKRKRDSRNASAHSFSGKLAGGGAELQDSKAAERTFSRVLSKVGGAVVGCLVACPGGERERCLVPHRYCCA